MTPAIDVSVPAPESAAAELHANLVAAGQTVAKEDYDTFLLSCRGGTGQLTAGCKGEIFWQTAHISELWVDESLRGQGIGAALLARADAEARQRGCHQIHIETRSEGARRLYEREGYEVMAELPRYQGAQSFYFLRKSL